MLTIDHTAGLPKAKATELSSLAKDDWGQLSKKEQKEITAEAVQELAERQDMKILAPHNVPLAALRDVQTANLNISTEVRTWFFARSFGI